MLRNPTRLTYSVIQTMGSCNLWVAEFGTRREAKEYIKSTRSFWDDAVMRIEEVTRPFEFFLFKTDREEETVSAR